MTLIKKYWREACACPHCAGACHRRGVEAQQSKRQIRRCRSPFPRQRLTSPWTCCTSALTSSLKRRARSARAGR